MTIKNVSVVGMGALGILFGKYIQDKIGKESVSFVVNKNRMKKYVQQGIICNGKRCSFNLIDEEIEKKIQYKGRKIELQNIIQYDCHNIANRILKGDD